MSVEPGHEPEQVQDPDATENEPVELAEDDVPDDDQDEP